MRSVLVPTTLCTPRTPWMEVGGECIGKQSRGWRGTLGAFKSSGQAGEEFEFLSGF